MLKYKIPHQLLIYLGLSLIVFVLFGAVSMQAKASQTSDLLAQGKQTFRFDIFGDKDFWGGALKLH